MQIISDVEDNAGVQCIDGDNKIEWVFDSQIN